MQQVPHFSTATLRTFRLAAPRILELPIHAHFYTCFCSASHAEVRHFHKIVSMHALPPAFSLLFYI